MKEIRRTDRPNRIIVAVDFDEEFETELSAQGIEIVKRLNLRELSADPHIDIDGVNTVMRVNYGHYGDFACPVMVIAKANYDDMLETARAVAASFANADADGIDESRREIDSPVDDAR